MAEPALYGRLGGLFAIAAVMNDFSDQLVRKPGNRRREPGVARVAYGDLPHADAGLKWGRTWWLATVAGPFEYTGREMRDVRFDLKISPEVSTSVVPSGLNRTRVLLAHRPGTPRRGAVT